MQLIIKETRLKEEVIFELSHYVFHQFLDEGLKKFHYHYNDNGYGRVTLYANSHETNVDDFRNTYNWLYDNAVKTMCS